MGTKFSSTDPKMSELARKIDGINPTEVKSKAKVRYYCSPTFLLDIIAVSSHEQLVLGSSR